MMSTRCIPHLFAELCLPHDAREQYYARLSLFHQLNIIFAISESTRRDAIPPASPEEIRVRYGVREHFILDTGEFRLCQCNVRHLPS